MYKILCAAISLQHWEREGRVDWHFISISQGWGLKGSQIPQFPILSHFLMLWRSSFSGRLCDPDSFCLGGRHLLNFLENTLLALWSF